MNSINVKNVNEPLSIKEMKLSRGGDPNDNATGLIDGDISGHGSCCAVSHNGSVICWVNKASAEMWAEAAGGWWCCDSCSSASWISACL